MNDNFKKLVEKFEKIKEKGWIKSCTKSTGAIGITFEKELGLLENNSFYPDYSNIEIKCVNKKTLFPLTLFSISFDGPGPRELHRIVDLYGYPDTTFNNRNILFTNLSCIHPYLVGNKYYFKLEIDRNNEKIFLVIYDINQKMIEKISYINFASIKNRLITKMKNLALIYGNCRFENNTFYFRYTDILLYTLKDFNVFLDLLETEDISINIGFRINKSKNHFGKSSSKNIVFTIAHNKIIKLFDKIN